MSDLRQGVCPKCDHRRTLHLTQITDSTGERAGEQRLVVDAAVDATEVGPSLPWRIARTCPPGVHRSSVVMAAGLVEAYACAACGFTEFYIRDPDLIPVDGKHVREVKGPENKGPFR